MFLISYLFFLQLSTATLSDYFSFGLNQKYDNIETIHSCIETVKNNYMRESCNKDTFEKVKKDIINLHLYSSIKSNLRRYLAENTECLINNDLEIDTCYKKSLDNIADIIEETTNINEYKQVLLDEKIKINKCTSNKNKVINGCQSSTFVIDNIRICVNGAIATFYKETYKNVRGGQSAKTDVNQALVSLQQQTIEDKLDIIGGTLFLKHIDLLMDRITFCSEMINKPEARGV